MITRKRMTKQVEIEVNYYAKEVEAMFKELYGDSVVIESHWLFSDVVVKVTVEGEFTRMPVFAVKKQGEVNVMLSEKHPLYNRIRLMLTSGLLKEKE